MRRSSISAPPSWIGDDDDLSFRAPSVQELDELANGGPATPIRIAFRRVDWGGYGLSSLDSCARFSRSRRPFPGLKYGACLAGSDTGVPVLGLRPTRARRKRTEKLPKPRISIRPPPARHAAMCSSIMLTANATSRSTRWDCVCAIRWISSDFVICPLSHRRRRHVLARELMAVSPLKAISRFSSLAGVSWRAGTRSESRAVMRDADSVVRGQAPDVDRKHRATPPPTSDRVPEVRMPIGMSNRQVVDAAPMIEKRWTRARAWGSAAPARVVTCPAMRPNACRSASGSGVPRSPRVQRIARASGGDGARALVAGRACSAHRLSYSVTGRSSPCRRSSTTQARASFSAHRDAGDGGVSPAADAVRDGRRSRCELNSRGPTSNDAIFPRATRRVPRADRKRAAQPSGIPVPPR